MQQQSVGILGLGAYMPEDIRGNDFWDPAVVDKWRTKLDTFFQRVERVIEGEPTEGQRLSLKAIEAQRNDPFQGAVRRHVIEKNMWSSDIEVKAAQVAIDKAGIDPQEIGAVFNQTLIPDYMILNNASVVQTKLGLSNRVFCINADSICVSFIMQLVLAEQFVRSGRAKYVLMVQSSAISRLLDYKEPFSAGFGDGATALVVGAVSEGKGLLGSAWRSDGNLQGAFMAGNPEGHWTDGRMEVYSGDRRASHKMILGTADLCAELVDEALTRADKKPSDVNFFACHQPTSWMRGVCQKLTHTEHARGVDIFPTTCSLTGPNIPLQLFRAAKTGDLKDGDLIACFAIGSGMSAAGAAIRWGR